MTLKRPEVFIIGVSVLLGLLCGHSLWEKVSRNCQFLRISSNTRAGAALWVETLHVSASLSKDPGQQHTPHISRRALRHTLIPTVEALQAAAALDWLISNLKGYDSCRDAPPAVFLHSCLFVAGTCQDSTSLGLSITVTVC